MRAVCVRNAAERADEDSPELGVNLLLRAAVVTQEVGFPGTHPRCLALSRGRGDTTRFTSAGGSLRCRLLARGRRASNVALRVAAMTTPTPGCATNGVSSCSCLELLSSPLAGRWMNSLRARS